jgi:hypothetical protein
VADDSFAVLYWRSYEAIRDGRETSGAEDRATEEIHRLARHGELGELLTTLEMLAHTAPDDGALGYLGAGPAESYLDRAARAYLFGNAGPVQALLQSAESSVELRNAARSAYTSFLGPPSFWRLLDASLGPPRHILRPWAQWKRRLVGPLMEGTCLLARAVRRRS